MDNPGNTGIISLAISPSAPLVKKLAIPFLVCFTIALNRKSSFLIIRVVSVKGDNYADYFPKNGMYLVDNGGESGIGIYAVDPRSVLNNPYEGMLPDDDYPELSGIPLDKFQVLKLPKHDKKWRKKLGIVNTGCNNFE